jgi:hypothetical protein
LRDIVVQPLNLPAQVVSGAPQGQVRVRFLSLGEVVADHIEKLVFRRHRRKIAGARGSRRPGFFFKGFFTKVYSVRDSLASACHRQLAQSC